MKVRYYLLIAGLTLLAPPLVQAQNGQKSGERNLAARIQRLLTGVNLTQAQRSGVDSILEYHRSRAPRSTGGEGNDAARREVLRQDIADIRTILTREQLEVFDRNAAVVMEPRRRD